MKQPSVYLKMRVLGAVDTAQGRTRHERILHVATMTFLDEDGNPRQFTGRTIQTWFYRYKNHGITSMTPQTRKDKGQVRQGHLEELLEAINAARPHFHNQRTNKRAFYRFCIARTAAATGADSPKTTFYRFLREYNLLAAQDDSNKKRLAFSMKFANQLWQADTMFGPYVSTANGARKQVRLIAFLDDASRVLCHGEFFFEENVGALVQPILGGCLLTNAAGARTTAGRQRLHLLLCGNHFLPPASAASCDIRLSETRRPRGRSNDFSAASAISSSSRSSDLSSLETLNRQFTAWPKAITTPCRTTPSA